MSDLQPRGCDCDDPGCKAYDQDRAMADPTYAAGEIMKQQARAAHQRIIERWHNHSSRTLCHPARCPAGGTGWDGRGLVSDHFTSPP